MDHARRVADGNHEIELDHQRGGASKLPRACTRRFGGRNAVNRERQGEPWNCFNTPTASDYVTSYLALTRSSSHYPQFTTVGAPIVILPQVVREAIRPAAALRCCASLSTVYALNSRIVDVVGIVFGAARGRLIQAASRVCPPR